MKYRFLPKLTISTLALTAALSSFASDGDRDFSIEAQSLDKALAQLSVQSDTIIVAAQELLTGRVSPNITGMMSTVEALGVLLDGTGLQYDQKKNGQIVITGGERKESKKSKESEVGEEVEEVIVTGTALLKDPGQVTKNVTIYNRHMIEASGATSIEEFMRTVPQNINAATEVGSGFTGEFGGAANVFGASGINLRGLGEAATLILIDGKRTANGGALGNAVDISTIPLSQVERIDVLLDGASSIYGADAIGGVVNIIMRQDYEGGMVNMEYQTPQDGGTEQFRFTMAKTFAWDSGNVSVNYSYMHRTPLNGEERPELQFSSRSPLSDSLASMPIVSPSNLTASERMLENGVVSLIPLYYVDGSGMRHAAREWVDDLYGPGFGYWGDVMSEPGWTAVYDAQLPTSGAVTLNNASQGWQDGPAPTFGRSLMPERNDHNIRINFKQDLTDDIQLSSSFTYGKSESHSSVSQQEVALEVPSYIFNDPDLGWGGWIQPNPVNPFNAGFTFAAVLTDVPDERRESERETMSASIGLDGTFGNDWQWDFGVSYSQADNNAVTYNQFDNFALFFLENGDNEYRQYDPSIGETVSIPFEGTYDVLSPNPYFGGTLETFTNDFIYDPQPVRGRNILKSAELTLQGSLFSLPAGEVNSLVRVGWKEREQLTSELSYSTGGGVVSRTLFGLRDVITHELESKGEEVTYYLAAEAFVPLVGVDQNIPLVQSLGLSLSGRMDELNYFDGTEPSLGLGAVWQLNDTLKVRYNYSNAFKAPSFNAYSMEEQVYVLGDYQDFYEGDEALNAPQYARTSLGGGNPNLEAETSTSNTLSLDVTPEALPGFKTTISYHRERQNSQLGRLPAQSIQLADMTLSPADFEAKYPGITVGDYSDYECAEDAAVCYDGYRYEDLRADTVAHYIFNTRIHNIGSTASDGVDVRASYFLDTDIGEFDFILDYGRTLSYKRREFDGCAGIPADECTLQQGTGTSTNDLKSDWWDIVGTSPVGSPFTAIPEHRTSLRANWSYSGFQVSLTARYQSDVSNVVKTRVNPYDRNNEEAVDQTRTYKIDPRVDLVAWYDFSEMASAPEWLGNTRIKLSVPDMLQAKTTIEVDPVLPSDRFAPLIPQFVNPYGRTFTLSVEKQF